MRYDAAKERWMPMEIRGIRGYFNDLRIDRNTVPEGFQLWELADGDNDGFPCRYRRGIFVNFFGTFITKGQLPMDDPEWGEGYIGSAAEWGWLAERSMTLEEIMKEEQHEKIRKYSHIKKNKCSNSVDKKKRVCYNMRSLRSKIKCVTEYRLSVWFYYFRTVWKIKMSNQNSSKFCFFKK